MSQEMTFDSFGFHTNLLKAISELGYEHPTPIQQKAIPLVLAGYLDVSINNLIGLILRITGIMVAYQTSRIV